MNITAAVKAAIKAHTADPEKYPSRYIARSYRNIFGRECTKIIRLMRDGSFGDCYDDGESYAESRLDIGDISAENWKVWRREDG